MPQLKGLTQRQVNCLVVLSAAMILIGGLARFAGSDSTSPRTDEPVNVELTAYQVPRLSFQGSTGWINSGPIRLEELRGKVVLLDFWTYCCINCHHVLPDLAFLEEKYKNALVVIGVHTAKFDAEKSTDNIRKKVAEYRIKHPVINDANHVLWNRFGVTSWPTMVVLDAKGKYAGSISGEGNRAILDEYIGKLIGAHREKKELNEAPLRFFAESEKPHDTGLLYPGKIIADPEGKRLFISDTGHNRIVIADLTGKTLKVAGDGEEGLADGACAKARFNRPQGMCLVGDTLYVCDTENHAIRAIDLKSDRVDTVAGNGKQSQRRSGQGAARETGLNSPWDILEIPHTKILAIAMAGAHQIWTFDPQGGTVGVWAGSGMEGIVDGPLGSAEFAQPSGLATDGQYLYVADSEASGLRTIPLGKSDSNSVQTVVGVDLFGFGDVDGRGSQVRLQHCLGVTFGDGKLFIADSYNNKIKLCERETRTVKTFVGSHAPGRTDVPPHFDEPGGLCVADSTLYVADTNNHLIRTVDLNSRKVGTLKIDVKAPALAPRPPSFPNKVVINVPSANVVPGKHIKLDVALSLPTGFKLNPEAPMPYLIETPGQTGALSADVAASGSRLDSPSERFSINVPLASDAQVGQTLTLKLSVEAYICREGPAGLCTIKSVVWNIPVTFAAGAPDHITLSNNASAAATP